MRHWDCEGETNNGTGTSGTLLKDGQLMSRTNLAQ